jgi:hypothetical protein
VGFIFLHDIIYVEPSWLKKMSVSGEPQHQKKEKIMAGKKPSFITGATAKIKIGNLTMAYAQDVSYSTTVTTIPIETMGRYEVVSNEPVACLCLFDKKDKANIVPTKYTREQRRRIERMQSKILKKIRK